MFRLDRANADFLDSLVNKEGRIKVDNSSRVFKQWELNELEETEFIASDFEEQYLGTDDQEIKDSDESEEIRAGEILKVCQAEDIGLKTEAMIKKAQSEADIIIAKAKEQADEVLKSAYEQGKVEGLFYARQKEEELVRELNEQFSGFLKQLKDQDQKRNEEIKRVSLKLALEIAKKIIGEEIRSEDEAFLSMLKKAIDKLNAKDEMVIYVSEQEYNRFFKDGSGIVDGITEGVSYKVSVDESMKSGDLRITSGAGMVDAGVKTQINEMADALDINLNETEVDFTKGKLS